MVPDGIPDIPDTAAVIVVGCSGGEDGSDGDGTGTGIRGVADSSADADVGMPSEADGPAEELWGGSVAVTGEISDGEGAVDSASDTDAEPPSDAGGTSEESEGDTVTVPGGAPGLVGVDTPSPPLEADGTVAELAGDTDGPGPAPGATVKMVGLGRGADSPGVNVTVPGGVPGSREDDCSVLPVGVVGTEPLGVPALGGSPDGWPGLTVAVSGGFPPSAPADENSSVEAVGDVN